VILTWDRVQTAHTALQENERRALLDEERAKMRAEIVAELQQANDTRAARIKRANLRWGGSVLITASAEVTAVMAIPGDDVWIKLALVTVSVLGGLVARPTRR
jgi:hypothetical protein